MSRRSRVKNSRESRRVSTRFRAPPRSESPTFAPCVEIMVSFMPDRLRGVYGARASVRAYVRVRIRVCVCVCARDSRDTAACENTRRYLPSRLPNTINVYRCALARERTHTRTRACAKVARRLRAEWHSRRVVPMRAGERRVRASVSISRALAHGHPRYNGCLADTARAGEPVAKESIARERIHVDYSIDSSLGPMDLRDFRL